MASRLLGPPVDRGMQQERTLLSWERTGLSLVAASLAVGRHALTGAIYAVPCALVAACGVWIYFTSLRQGREARSSPREPRLGAILHGEHVVALGARLMTLLCLGEAYAALHG